MMVAGDRALPIREPEDILSKLSQKLPSMPQTFPRRHVALPSHLICTHHHCYRQLEHGESALAWD